MYIYIRSTITPPLINVRLLQHGIYIPSNIIKFYYKDILLNYNNNNYYLLYHQIPNMYGILYIKIRRSCFLYFYIYITLHYITHTQTDTGTNNDNVCKET